GSGGDIDLADGTYNLSLIGTNGQTHTGEAYLNQIGTMLTVQLFCTLGNFNFSGRLETSTTMATSHFEATGADYSELTLEFSPNRDSFTGDISIPLDITDTEATSSAVYLVHGTKI
ncbi:hypothetical protein ACFL1F_00900, partial [Chlamydiota bacterium]